MSEHFEQEAPVYRSPAAETPYVKAKQQWDKRLADFALSADFWRKSTIISAGFALLLLIALLISLSWHKPQLYVAQVAPNGQVMNVRMLAESYQPTQAQEEYFITQFIKLVRSIPLDPVAARNNWHEAYNFLNLRGSKVLDQFFQKNNPLEALSKKTVTVTITDINPVSKNSYEVDWVEQSVNKNGQILGQQTMSGIFTIIVDPPKTKEHMLENPLGIYIIDFHISPRVAIPQN